MSGAGIPASAVEAAARAIPAGASIDRDDVAVILEAAAPYIRAEVLRMAAAHLEYGNPVSSWLEGRADEMEAYAD
jgi:hypothetical protein